MRKILTLLGCLAGLLPVSALACGPDTDCVVAGDRTYRLYVPEGATGPMGAIFHAHGYGGSADRMMDSTHLREMADNLGMALIAFQAGGQIWDLARGPQAPDRPVTREFDYVRAVIDDVATRVDLNRDQLIATGFSAGGMMTWELACGMSDAFLGFVPYGGTFWGPVPETCPTPAASLIHIHGLSDTVVPLTGRPIQQAHQGNVLDAFAMYVAHAGLPAPDRRGFRHGTGCLVSMDETAPAGGMALCVFDGGHSYSATRVEWAIEQILEGQ